MTSHRGVIRFALGAFVMVPLAPLCDPMLKLKGALFPSLIDEGSLEAVGPGEGKLRAWLSLGGTAGRIDDDRGRFPAARGIGRCLSVGGSVCLMGSPKGSRGWPTPAWRHGDDDAEGQEPWKTGWKAVGLL